MSFAERLAEVASGEHAKWVSFGGDDKFGWGRTRVGGYWHVLGMPHNSASKLPNGKPIDWSPAFLAWAMQEAGMPWAEFPYNVSPSAYVRWAIVNTELDKPGQAYYGRKRQEYAPKPGDLIAKVHSGKVAYDSLPDRFFEAQCEIVVANEGNRVSVVSGDTNHRVSLNRYYASNGMINANADLIAILDCQK